MRRPFKPRRARWRCLGDLRRYGAFAEALRRSELVALDVKHLEFNPARGPTVLIAGS